MRRLGLRLLTGLLLALTMPAVFAQKQNDDAKVRAREILRQARAAVGGEAALKALQSFSFSGESRRIVGKREVNNQIEFEMIMPDKIKRTTTMTPFPSIYAVTIEVVNGDQVWYDYYSSRVLGESSGSAARLSGSYDKNLEARQNNTRSAFLRILLGVLAMTPLPMNVEYAYVGEAKAPDGTADVIEFKGPGNSVSRVFVDKNTRHVLMISYRSNDVHFDSETRPSGSQQKTPINREALRKEIEERMAKTPEVDFFLRFAEHKNVNGLTLPHLISLSTGGNIREELVIDKFNINPKLKAGQFIKKGK